MNNLRCSLTLAVGLVASGSCELVLAADLQESTLSGGTGAIDQYLVSCPAGTQHVQVKAARPLAPTATLQQNLKVSKGGTSAAADAVTPGMTGATSLDGGNGKYSVSIDTSGSTAASKQAYSVAFQCLNASGQSVKTSLTSSSAGNLKKKAKKFSVTCSKTKAGGNAQTLSVQLTNTTKGTAVLIAQVLKGAAAVSVPENYPGELAGADGDYQVLVAHNGSPAQSDFQYALQSSCLDGAEAEVGTPVVTLLQSSLPR